MGLRVSQQRRLVAATGCRWWREATRGEGRGARAGQGMALWYGMRIRILGEIAVCCLVHYTTLRICCRSRDEMTMGRRSTDCAVRFTRRLSTVQYTPTHPPGSSLACTVASSQRTHEG